MADSRYIIDIILKARDDTASAVRAAGGNLDRYSKALEDADKRAIDSNKRLEQSSAQAAAKLDDLNESFERNAHGSKKAAEAMVELRAAQDALVKSQSQGREDRIILDTARATDALKEYRQALVDANKDLPGYDGTDADRGASRADALSKEIAQLREQSRLYGELESQAKKFSKATDVREISRYRQEMEDIGKALRRAGADAKTVSDTLGQAFDTGKVEQYGAALERTRKTDEAFIKQGLEHLKAERELRERVLREHAQAAARQAEQDAQYATLGQQYLTAERELRERVFREHQAAAERQAAIDAHYAELGQQHLDAERELRQRVYREHQEAAERQAALDQHYAQLGQQHLDADRELRERINREHHEATIRQGEADEHYARLGQQYLEADRLLREQIYREHREAAERQAEIDAHYSSLGLEYLEAERELRERINREHRQAQDRQAEIDEHYSQLGLERLQAERELREQIRREHYDASVRQQQLDEENTKRGLEYLQAEADLRQRIAREHREAEERDARDRSTRERNYQSALRESLSLESKATRARGAGAPQSVQTKLDADTGEALVKLEAAAVLIRELDGKDIDVKVDLDTGRFLAGASAVRRETKGMEGDGKSLLGVISGLGEGFNNSSQSIASFDNFLRGLLTLGITVFFSQLIAVVASLGGMLFSLAASAAQAGAALGGALVAGASQALPVLGILGAVASRLSNVMNAVKQANLLQEQQSYQGAKAAKTQANALDSLTSAHEAVANAQRGVARAQENLTKTRRDAVRQLQDLILAERSAELAAEGASLSQEDAQRQLQAAISSGGDIRRAQLDVRSADLGTTQAQRNLQKAHQALDDGRNPEQTDAVKNARERLLDAQRAADQAARQVARAERTSKIAEDNITSAAGKLAFLRAQMSAAERDLFDATIRLQNRFHTFAKEVSEPIIVEFTRAVNRASRLLRDPGILAAANALSDAMAGAFRKVLDAFTTPEMIERIEGFAYQAKKNLEPLADIVINLGTVFTNLADAAAPALNSILEWLSGISQSLADMTSGFANQEKLTAFFDNGVEQLKSWAGLLYSIVKLFMAIAGVGGAADVGKNAVDDLASAIDNAAGRINTAGSKAREFWTSFFDKSREVIDALGPILSALADEFQNIFGDDPAGGVRGFAQMMTEVIIPALGGFVRVLEKITGIFAWLIQNVPFLGSGLKDLLGIALVVGVLTKLGGLVAPIKLVVNLVKDWGKVSTAIASDTGKLATNLGKIVSLIPGLGGLGAALGGAGARQTAKAAAKTATAETAEAVAGNAAAGAAGGAVADKARQTTSKRIAEQLARETGDIAAGAGGNFATRFVGGFGSALKLGFKAFGWIGVAIAVVDGLAHAIPAALKYGSIKAAAADFGHALTFGLIDSAEEVANRELPKIQQALQKRMDAVRKGTALPKEFRVPQMPKVDPKEYRTPNQALQPGDELKELDKRLNAANGKSEFDKWLDNLPKRVRGAAKGLPDLQNDLVQLEKNRDYVGLQSLSDKLQELGRRFPELSGAIAQMADDTKKSMDKVYGSFAPQRLALDLGKQLQLDPKHWRSIVNEATLEIKKLPPGMQKEAEGAVLSMVKGLRKDHKLPEDAAGDIGERVVKKFSKMRAASNRQSAKLASDAADDFAAMQTAVSISMDQMGTDLNSTLAVLGMKGLSFPSLRSKNAAPTKLHLNKSPFSDPLGGLRAVGGFIGAAGERGRDAVHTVLGRGEAVLNWGQQQAVNANLRGQETLNSILNRSRGWHAGGQDSPGYATGRPGGADFGSHPSDVNSAIRKLIALMQSKFPLQVSSTTDHSYLTTSGNVSDHTRGAAVDLSGPVAVMNRAARYVLTSGLARQLKQAIYNGSPQLAWSGGKDVGPGYFGPAVMGQHTNHLHLAAAGALRKVSDAASAASERVGLIRLSGDSALHKIGNAVLEKANEAMNTLLRSKAAAVDSETDASVDVKGSNNGERIFRYFRQRGFNDDQAAAFVGNFVQESGLNPGAIQPNGQGHGLGQWGGGRFSALQAFAKQRGTPWQNLQTQLDFVWHELTGSEGAAYRSIKAAKSLEAAVNAVGVKYERYGIAGDRTGPAKQALYAYGGQFADGGIVPGGTGRPVNITAHAGEWVLNGLQQSKLANALGTGVGKLRSMLGFTGGPSSFAGGGSVGGYYSTRVAAEDQRHEDAMAKLKGKNNADERKAEEKRHADRLKHIKEDESAERKRFKDVSDERQRVSNVGRGAYETPSASVLPRGPAGIARELSRLTRANHSLGTGAVDRLQANLENLTNETDGLLKVMTDALDRQTARMTTAISLAKVGFTRRVVNGVNRLVATTTRLGRQTFLTDAAEIAERELKALEASTNGLRSERAAISSSLGSVERSIKKFRGGHDSDAYQQLIARRIGLKDALVAQDEKLAQNYSDRYDKAVEAFNAQTDNALARNRRRSSFADRRASVAQAFGLNTSGIADEQAKIAKGNEDTLRKRLADARRAAKTNPKMKAVADDLADQLNQAVGATADATHNALQTAVDEIANRYERRAAKRDRSTRIAQLTGNQDKIQRNMEAGIADLHANVADLAAKALEAHKAGDHGLERQLKDQAAELTTQISEKTAEKIQQAADAADDAFAKTDARLGVRGRLADLLERGGDRLGAMRSRMGISEERATALGKEQASVGAQYDAAQKAGLTVLATQLKDKFDDLTASIAEETAARADLTFQYRQAALDVITGKVERTTGLIGSAQGIAEKLAAATGTTADTRDFLKQQGRTLTDAVPAIADQVLSGSGEFKGEAGGVLESLRSAFLSGPGDFASKLAELAPSISGLESTMGDAQKTTFQALIDAMVHNTEGVLDNTKAVNDATGALSGPQGFASSAWSWYRQAIFTGNSNVLPQYAVPHMATGGAITKGGIFELHAGEFVINPQGTNVPDSGDININMNSVNGDVDLTALAARIAFAKKNRR